MSRKFKLITLLALLLSATGFSGGVVAHDGDVDEEGCHLDDEGRRHCH